MVFLDTVNVINIKHLKVLHGHKAPCISVLLYPVQVKFYVVCYIHKLVQAHNILTDLYYFVFDFYTV